MDRDTMTALAREAGISESHASGMQGFLERFAALVAAHEREECARVCEAVQDWPEGSNPYDCAAAIRSRT